MMNKREFEKQLFKAMRAWDVDDANYEWMMDDLTVDCSEEQWQIVQDTFELMRDPDYVTTDGKLGEMYMNAAKQPAPVPQQAASTPAGGVGDAVADARRIEGLSTQIVHAQMVLQTALGYQEVDYSISLTDLAEDVATLQAEVTRLRESLERVRDHKMDDFPGVDPSRQAEVLKIEFRMIQQYISDVLDKSKANQ